MTIILDSKNFMRVNEIPPIKSKPEETQRRKVMGLLFEQDKEPGMPDYR